LLGNFCATKKIHVLKEISTELFNHFKLERSKSLAPITWSKELDNLRAFFSFCVQLGWIDVNPAEEITRIIEACGRLPTTMGRLRAKAMILLMRLLD